MVVFQIIRMLLSIFLFLIIARALLSWLPNVDYRNPLVQFLHDVTEPVLRPIREAIPAQNTGGLDLSPLIVIVIIQVLQILLPG